MKLLLTGGSGFIGSYFIDHYSDIYHIETFSFLKDDLESLNMKNIDTIFHLSALVHQMDGAKEEEYERVNVTQTINFAKKAKKCGVKHFIFMSTVKVYGEESDTIYNEKSPCIPQDAYGISKLKAEEALIALEDSNFSVSILRTPIVYGYGVKANIKNLIKLVDKVSILPFGNIKNHRSMVYVGNLCYFAHILMQNQQSGIFLASDNTALSTTQFITNIGKVLHKNIYLIQIPFFETLLKFIKPSFHKRLYKSLMVDNRQTMQTLFGDTKMTLPYSIEEGIRFMIEGERR